MMSYHFCVYQVLFQKINMYYKHWLDIALNGGKHWLQRTSTATTSMAPVSVLIYQNNLYNIRWPSKIKMHIDKFWWRCRYMYIYMYVIPPPRWLLFIGELIRSPWPVSAVRVLLMPHLYLWLQVRQIAGVDFYRSMRSW